MIDPVLFGFFILASIALVASPGPFVSLIIAETLKNGKAFGIAAIIGAFFAGLLFFIIYYMGASYLLDDISPFMFDLLRYGGIAMLLWMAWGMFSSKGEFEDTKGIRKDKSPMNAGIRGFLVCFINPKPILFFAVFFPQFIDKSLPVNPQILIMGIAFLLIAILSDLMWLAISLKAKSWIFQKGGHSLINKISGSVLSLGAVALLFLN